jgi:hypothetical protein
MSTEIEEQLKRLSGYIVLMGLNTDENSQFAATQKACLLKDSDTIDLLKRIQIEIKKVARLSMGTKCNLDELIIQDLCLFLTIITNIWNALKGLKEEVEELQDLQAQASEVNIITFGLAVKNEKNEQSFKIKDKINVEFIIDAVTKAINDQQEKVYENLLIGRIQDKRVADSADKFLYKATYLLSEFLKEKENELYNPPVPKLISGFYRYTSILETEDPLTDELIEGQRKTIDNWIRYGRNIIEGK